MDLIRQFEAIFNPRSVAIVGASSDPMKFGNWVAMTALKSRYSGEIHLVNPKAGEIAGRKMYPSLRDVPGDVDLVGIVVPAEAVPVVLRDCAKKGVKGAIIFTAGFREIGLKGVEREQEMLAVARDAGIRLIGPNCMGIYSASSGINLTILSAEEGGNVGFITQSGGYGIGIFASAMAQGIRFSRFISTGDKADLQDHEYLEHLANDPETKTIMLYLEGLEEGREFFELARKVTREKPIFAIKIGRTKAGGAAARSHTGALAGADEVYDAAFKQAGIIRAYDVEELFDYVRAYLSQPLPKGNRVGMVVGSGGLGCAAVDKCSETGLTVPRLSQANESKLKGILPEFASIANPVDFTATGAMGLFSNLEMLKSLFADPEVDAWFLGFTGSSISGIDDIVDSFGPLLDQINSKDIIGVLDKPLVGTMDEHDKLIRPLLQKMFGVTLYGTPERAIRALAGLVRYRTFITQAQGEGEAFHPEVDREACRRIIGDALKEGRKVLTEIEAKEILKAYKIPVTETKLASSAREAASMAVRLGFPVALKIVSPEIVHKSDAGGVKLDLRTRQEIERAFKQIVAAVKKNHVGAQILGVSVQNMAPPGIEVMIGAKRDPQFGPVVVFGLGGIFVELFRDVSLRLIPIGRAEALAMIGELRAKRLLEGFRQHPPVDREVLAAILLGVSTLMAHNPEIREMDLNPVFAYPDKALAVDARIILE